MAYETGSATGVNDLIGKIKTFLENNGYTINNFTAAGTGYRLNVQKGSWYINMRSAVNENVGVDSWSFNLYGVAINGSTGYDAGATGGIKYAWMNQPGKPYGTSSTSGVCSVAGGMTGAIPSYYFFLDADGFAACIEISTGVYRWLFWGQLTLFGNVGGASLDGFFTGAVTGYDSTLNNDYNPFCRSAVTIGAPLFLYFSVAGYTQKWFAATRSTNTNYSTGLLSFPPLTYSLTSSGDSDVGYLHNLMRAIPGNIGNLTPLLPCIMGVLTPSSETILGHYDMVRITRIAGFTTGQEVSIGGKIWKVFPGISRTHADGYAVAVKKVA